MILNWLNTFEAKRRERENFAKRKRKMGYSIGEMTAKELAKKEGVTVRAIGIPFAKLHREGNPLFPMPFSQSLQLSPEQIEALRPKRAPIKKTRTDTATQAVNIAMIDAGRPNEVAPNVVPKEPTDYALMFGAAVLLCIVLGHAALIWYDCAVLWATPGKIAGGIVFMLILAGVALMGRERAKSVSDDLLWFVWLLDGLAIFVHYPTFWHSATIGYQFGIREFETWAMSGVVCVCSGAAVYFYRQILKK